ncbi:MAG TPA: hypothetical protein VIU40_09815 [Geobacteraceae bacterium]
MKRLVTLAVGCILTVCLVAAVNAAPAGTAGKPPQQQGLKNAKKAMESRLERDKKVQEVRKNAQAKRQQAQRGK